MVSLVVANIKSTLKFDWIEGEVRTAEFNSLEKDDVVELELVTRPGTGYGWYLSEADEKNLSIVKSINTESYEGLLSGERIIEPRNDDELIIGGPSKVSFKFKVVGGQGKEEVSLKYFRPWEKDSLPYSTIKVTFATK